VPLQPPVQESTATNATSAPQLKRYHQPIHAARHRSKEIQNQAGTEPETGQASHQIQSPPDRTRADRPEGTYSPAGTEQFATTQTLAGSVGFQEVTCCSTLSAQVHASGHHSPFLLPARDKETRILRRVRNWQGQPDIALHKHAAVTGPQMRQKTVARKPAEAPEFYAEVARRHREWTRKIHLESGARDLKDGKKKTKE